MLEMWVLTVRQDPVVSECDHHRCNPDISLFPPVPVCIGVAHQVW